MKSSSDPNVVSLKYVGRREVAVFVDGDDVDDDEGGSEVLLGIVA